jgi:hypothetical protein
MTVLKMLREVLHHIDQICNKINNSSSKSTMARRHWEDTFKALREKDCHLRMNYLAKLPFKNEGEINTFPDNKKLID